MPPRPAARATCSTALAEAEAAAARGEVPVGAVIVAADGAVLAKAGNRTRELADPTAHAELLAIRQACQALGSERLGDADIYVTLEPCPMCAAASRLRGCGGSTSAPAIPRAAASSTGRASSASRPATMRPRCTAGSRRCGRARCCGTFFESRR